MTIWGGIWVVSCLWQHRKAAVWPSPNSAFFKLSLEACLVPGDGMMEGVKVIKVISVIQVIKVILVIQV